MSNKEECEQTLKDVWHTAMKSENISDYITFQMPADDEVEL